MNFRKKTIVISEWLTLKKIFSRYCYFTCLILSKTFLYIEYLKEEGGFFALLIPYFCTNLININKSHTEWQLCPFFIVQLFFFQYLASLLQSLYLESEILLVVSQSTTVNKLISTRAPNPHGYGKHLTSTSQLNHDY